MRHPSSRTHPWNRFLLTKSQNSLGSGYDCQLIVQIRTGFYKGTIWYPNLPIEFIFRMLNQPLKLFTQSAMGQGESWWDSNQRKSMYLFLERVVKIPGFLSPFLNCWGIVVLLFVFLLPNVLNNANTHQVLLLRNVVKIKQKKLPIS